CERVSQKIKVTLDSIAVDSAGGDSGNDLELYGTITAIGTNGPVTLFSKDGDHYVTIKEGQQFGGGTPLGEGVITVVPKAGASLRMQWQPTDQDPLFSDDIGNDPTSEPFETGWRKDVTMTLTGSSARVRVNFRLSPI